MSRLDWTVIVKRLQTDTEFAYDYVCDHEIAIAQLATRTPKPVTSGEVEVLVNDLDSGDVILPGGYLDKAKATALVTAFMAKHGVSQWRDISTAPKDGTRILLSDGKDTSVGSWHDTSCTTEELVGKGPKRTIYKTVTHENGYWDNAAEICGDATHWMPLPPAPQHGLKTGEGE